MKKPLICLFSFLIILQACKKEINYTTLTGKYRLTQVSGGFAGTTIKYSILGPYSLQLKADSTYIRASPASGLSVSKDTGTYSIDVQPTMDGKDTILTTRSAIITNHFSLHRNGAVMYLTSIDYSEGFTAKYVKVND